MVKNTQLCVNAGETAWTRTLGLSRRHQASCGTHKGSWALLRQHSPASVGLWKGWAVKYNDTNEPTRNDYQNQKGPLWRAALNKKPRSKTAEYRTLVSTCNPTCCRQRWGTEGTATHFLKGRRKKTKTLGTHRVSDEEAF